MTPLFHKRSEEEDQPASDEKHVPSLYELGPKIDEAAERVGRSRWKRSPSS